VWAWPFWHHVISKNLTKMGSSISFLQGVSDGLEPDLILVPHWKFRPTFLIRHISYFAVTRLEFFQIFLSFAYILQFAPKNYNLWLNWDILVLRMSFLYLFSNRRLPSLGKSWVDQGIEHTHTHIYVYIYTRTGKFLFRHHARKMMKNILMEPLAK